jgi:PAS domain S-box-containing protein
MLSFSTLCASIIVCGLLLALAAAGNRSLRRQIDANTSRLARTVEEKVRLSEALHTSHDRYRLLVDSVQDYAIFLLSIDGDVASWNVGAERVSGYTAEEAFGLPFSRFYTPEEAETGAPQRALEQAAAAGRFECEGWRMRRDGSRFWATVVLTPLTDDEAGLCGFSCITRDVTERRRVEAQLAFQARVLSQVNEPIVGVDAEGRVTYWNSGAERLYGVLAADAVGRPLSDSYTLSWIRPGDEARAKATFAATGSWVGEQIHRRRSGETIYVESFISVLTDDRGEPIGSLAAARDVTERRRAREALHARAHQQAAIAELCQHALAESNVDALMREAVRTLVRTLEIDAACLLQVQTDGQSLVVRSAEGLPSVGGHTAVATGTASQAGYTLTVDEPVTVSDLARESRFTDRTLLDERVVSGVSVIIRSADGPYGVLSAHARAHRAFTTDDVHFLESVANIFGVALERARAEAALRETEANYQHTQKLESLGVLAGGIAHDFNNLLLGVLGHAGLARMELATDSPVHSRLEQIELTAQRAAELTNQMLAYSGKGRFVVQPVDLSTLVQEMTHLLHTVISKKAQLRFDFAPGLPAVNVDASQIRQVVMNLITNASDALGDENGTITIRTGLVRADATYLADTYVNTRLPSGPYVFVEVADSGCGMDAATRARIFDPFYTTKFTGRGLGLAAVLGIVRGHHGAIKLYSEPKLGTIFKVLLPAAAQPVQTADKPAPVRDTWQSSGGVVLVVDDEEGVRIVAQGVLERCGFDVIEACDGREGVDVFREHASEIRAVLLDMTMPRMNGVEALREIRRIRRDVPVILSSGYSEEDAADHFQFGEQDLAGFIQKPYAAAGLVDKIRQVLEA